MKIHQLMLVTIMAAAFALAGCKKSGGSVDTAKLESSFKSAEPATQSSVDKAVSAIKSADYAGALAELKSVAEKAKLTPEQEQAIKDVIAQVQQALADTAKKVGEDASKAVGDLQNSLKK
jgi:hypothetical protein